MARCSRCASLCIEGLVELTGAEFAAFRPPRESYYNHHQSFNDLEESAHHGCDLCRFILECFKHTPSLHVEPQEWSGEWIENLEVDGPEDVKETMYFDAKALEVSDIRISVDSTNVWFGNAIDGIDVFDLLLVQVGPVAEDDSESDNEWSFPPLRLTISTPPQDQPVQVGRFRIGRYETDPDLASSFNFDMARRWLSECRQSHTSCLTNEIHELPTRVIDVESSSDPDVVRLFISQGMSADYVALSHCWGGAISPLLTAETMLPFQKAICMSELPANFRDAITITRNLGIRYLWIDSLCIQQDSKLDWEMESKKMGLIYRNSTVTISALVSSGSTHGILHAGKPHPSHKNWAPVKVFKGHHDAQEVIVRRHNANEEDLRLLELRSALMRRGWTLQEFILSPRNLLYGKEMIYWSCPRGYLSSDGMPEGSRTPEVAFAEMSQVIYSDILRQPQSLPPDVDAVLADYYELVKAYAMRRLTYGSDKLPAFSGLAQRLHPAIGGEYAAGIWTADFRNGLLWKNDVTIYSHPRETYRAPSWSWAVSDSSVLYEHIIDRKTQRSIRKSGPLGAQLVGHNVKPRNPDNPYGEVLSAELVVKALTVPFIRSRQGVALDSEVFKSFSIGGLDFDEQTDAENALSPFKFPFPLHITTEEEDYVLSMVSLMGHETDVEIDHSLYSDIEYVLMLVHAGSDMSDEAEWPPPQAACLILERLREDSQDGPCVYKRVGIASILVTKRKLEWFKTWEWQTLTLV